MFLGIVEMLSDERTLAWGVATVSTDHTGRTFVEMLVNFATNGAISRIDERATRARELRQWGLRPHHAEPASSLAADNEAFTAAYPLVLAGDAAVTQESLYPMMNASENLDAAGLLVEQRTASGSLYASSIL